MTNEMAIPPKVSICVVAYNHERYIGQCLQSILDQVVDFNFEVIVGDDCSTDDTFAVIQTFVAKYPGKIKAFRQPVNIGATKNYLQVHGAATGELICHCDGDDYWLPNKLQAQTTFMDEHPECNLSGHRMYVTDERLSLSVDGRRDLATVMDLSAFYVHGNFLPHSSTMYRAILGKIPNDLTIEIIDFLTHIWRVKDGKIGFINEYLGVYRRHGNSMTSSAYKSMDFFDMNLMALEEIHKVVKDTNEFEKRKFFLCMDYAKNFIVNGRTELAKEIVLGARRVLAKKRHAIVLELMILFDVVVALSVRTKRRLH